MPPSVQSKACFNPRLHAGGDTLTSRSTVGIASFQSAPPRGRRLLRGKYLRALEAFQSAPPRGRRHSRRVRCNTLSMVSIRASTREATSGQAWP